MEFSLDPLLLCEHAQKLINSKKGATGIDASKRKNILRRKISFYNIAIAHVKFNFFFFINKDENW